MFNMFHSECFSCHKRAAAAIDRRINNGRLVERPPLFVAVLRCVFNAARELVQFHKELSHVIVKLYILSKVIIRLTQVITKKRSSTKPRNGFIFADLASKHHFS